MARLSLRGWWALLPRCRLFLAVIAAYSLHISTGAVIGWPSPMMPRLNLTDDQDSLLSSLFSLGAAPGPVLVSLTLDKLGRKGTLFLLSTAFLLSWALLLASRDLVVMYIARLIGGVGIGGAFAGVSVYVAEICDEKSRGPLGSLLQTFIAIGLLVEYCVGPWVGDVTLAGVSLAFTLFFILVFAFTPESPHYLLEKEKIKEAYSAILWLRGDITDEEVNNEIAQIQNSLREEKESVYGIRKVLKSWAVHRGLGICFFLLMMQQGSGTNAILAYVQYIFEQANIHLSAKIVAILVGFVNLFGSLPAPFLVKRFGNRAIYVVSTLGSGICLCLLGLYFYLITLDYNYGPYLGILPVASVLLYYIFFCIGLGPLVWGTAAELFSPSVKGIAMAICGVFSAIFGFFTIVVFSEILHTYGLVTVFLGFGIYLILGSIGCYLLVPDSSRMSLREIQVHLQGKSKR